MINMLVLVLVQQLYVVLWFCGGGGGGGGRRPCQGLLWPLGPGGSNWRPQPEACRHQHSDSSASSGGGRPHWRTGAVRGEWAREWLDGPRQTDSPPSIDAGDSGL